MSGLYIQQRALPDDVVNDLKLKLRNNQYLRARNAANSADVNVVKLNASNAIEFASVPVVGSDLVQTAADKGVANGLATLDGSGKIPSSQLTVEVMEYKGTWNANTNSPSLANGTGSTGDLYQVSTAGSTDFGAGSIAFAIGDKAVYNGTVWEKWLMTDAVTSVNGATGVVVLDADDITYTQTDPADWTVADGSNLEVTLDEVGSRLVALEGAPSAYLPEQQNITLNGTDITNQYVTLAQSPVADSVHLSVVGFTAATPGVDFSISGGNQLNFLGNLATLAISGDVLVVHYLY